MEINFEYLENENRKLNKIYKCIESCNTLEQFNNAFKMLVNYSKNRPNDTSIVIHLSKIQDYAILKGKNLLLNN